MPDWQERITKETAPAIRVEHDVRYAAAAPLVLASAAWADLGGAPRPMEPTAGLEPATCRLQGGCSAS